MDRANERSTRKKVIKTVYKDEDDSEAEVFAGDFSDSGSEAKISEHSSSEDDEVYSDASSGLEFNEKSAKKFQKAKAVRKTKFAKNFINKISKQLPISSETESIDVPPPLFSVKDLTDADKLLPSFLNLSESDSSEDEAPKLPAKKHHIPTPAKSDHKGGSDSEAETEYKDVWLNNIQDDSEEIAKKTFLELELHKTKIEETKASILNYTSKIGNERESDVKDLLAQGEDILPQSTVKKRSKHKKARDESDSEMEDWEEVKEAKSIPQQGLQLVVDIPDVLFRKTKKVDVEMMMKRKMNRVKKEYQVYMHKVHVLCWLGHGNYISRVLNDQEILAAALSLVPSKDCYPGVRVDMKYVEQITTWYKDKFTLKQDKHEDKFKPKAPPLKEILLGQVKSRVVSTKKNLVFIFVSMLRALGLQCRIMFNFVTLPIKPPTSELCSLSTKPQEDKKAESSKTKPGDKTKIKGKGGDKKSKSKDKMSQMDGNEYFSSDSDIENIMQVDGNNDVLTGKRRMTRIAKAKKHTEDSTANDNEDVSPPKRTRKSLSPKASLPLVENNNQVDIVLPQKRKRITRKVQNGSESDVSSNPNDNMKNENPKQAAKTPQSRRRKISDNKSPGNKMDQAATSSNQPKTNNTAKSTLNPEMQRTKTSKQQLKSKKLDPPKIVVTNEKGRADTLSEYFEHDKKNVSVKRLSLSRRRSQSTNPSTTDKKGNEKDKHQVQAGPSTKSALVDTAENSKYFHAQADMEKTSATSRLARQPRRKALEDNQRVSHRDLLHLHSSTNSEEQETKKKILAKKKKNDVTADLVGIIKNRVKEAKEESKRGIVKGKIQQESDEDSDYLPEEYPNRRNSKSDDDFKPMKISPKPSTSRKIDRRVLSSDDDTPKNRSDVWCEVFVEELEQWIAVDVVKGKAHCTNEIYGRCTHPVCYIVGWDNNNYLKDLTRRYVPHWNTVTRKQRAEPTWWDTAVRPYLAPKTARDREEDEQLNRLQLEAPLPKTISEYKNHPLYALKRHLLKFEAIYPPDAATLGFVRGEAVYARECIYVCRSRDTWLKEAKVVRLGEKPYKIVKARPKWDRLSNKLITDKPLEVFGPWQVQDYEPPVAENGIVPRNAYGNVELFKECMLPKGTVHIKLPGLNKVAKKLNIDCAPAMTGFDFNGGWSHPVYDGFVVCQEFGEIITEAWVEDQEEQERKEQDKIENRVYGNWKRLIKGLLIKERLKNKYGFQGPTTSKDAKKAKAPRLVVKKRG